MKGNISKVCKKGSKGEDGHTPSIVFRYDSESGNLYYSSDGILLDKEYVESQNLVTKEKVINTTEPTYAFDFSNIHNYIVRMGVAEVLTFLFGENLPETYYSELSFDSGENPTSITYQNGGKLTWIGDDCYTTQAGLSVFEPRPDTSYDVVFYTRGGHIIGKVCGYTPSISR